MAGSLTLPPPVPLLTVDDVVRAGACPGGAGKRLDRVSRAGTVAAAEPADRLLTLVPEEERQYIEDAAICATIPGHDPEQSNGDGDGYGYGDGYGDGYGYGYG
ncbi:hypothetical protein AAG607_12235, partial [Citromicrobium bathyomarinum]